MKIFVEIYEVKFTFFLYKFTVYDLYLYAEIQAAFPHYMISKIMTQFCT